MINRDKVLSILHKRFPEASQQEVAWAANAIVGLGDEWEESSWDNPEVASSGSIRPVERRYLASEIRRGTEFHIFRRRWPDVRQ